MLRAEVEAFRTGAELPSFVSVLTQEPLATGFEAGAVRGGGSDAATDVVPELLDPEWKRLLPLRRVYAVDRAAGGA